MTVENVTTSLADEIAAHNESVDKSLIETPDETPDDATVVLDEPEIEDEEELTENITDEDESGEITITPDSDLETFERERAAYLETVDITPQLQAILDRQDAELTATRTQLAELSSSSADENAARTLTALNQLFETEIVNNQVVPNAKPLVEVLRTDYANEFPVIANEIMSADSTKYHGASVFQELLIDNFGATPQKLAQIENFLQSPTATLPVQNVSLPKGVDAKLTEAYNGISEIKRFEIESLADEIARLEKELADEPNEYFKTTIKDALGQAQNKLNAEVDTLQKIQVGIESQRATEATTARQQAEAYQKFEAKTMESYNAEIFGMADAFVNDLAPRLTFVEGTAQTSQARNILARIQNSLAFEFYTDQSGDIKFIPNPTADYYAKQMTEEGIQFDFSKARELLQNHFKATRKVALLEAKNASPAAIANAKQAKNNILKDLKTEHLELLGQISSKFVTSSNKALETKVKAVADKKQKTRAVISKGGSGVVPRSEGNLKKEIDNYNRKVAAIDDGDDLYDYYAK